MSPTSKKHKKQKPPAMPTYYLAGIYPGWRP